MSATRLIRSWFVEEGKFSPSFISFLLLIAATVPHGKPALINGYLRMKKNSIPPADVAA